MKIVSLALLGFLVSGSAFALCPAKEDKISCTALARQGADLIYENRSIGFSVFESTFLCDGRSNRFFYKEYDMTGTPLKLGLYAGWDSYRMAFYRQTDHGGVDGSGSDALAQAWGVRGGVKEESSTFEGTIDGINYFVSCQTESTGTERN